MNGVLSDVELAGLPAEMVDQGVTYLTDVLRECQLILIDNARRPLAARFDVVALAKVLVPDLEEVRDLFRSAVVTVTDGRADLTVALKPSIAATLVHLQMHLVQLRFVECEGGILVESDLEVTDLLRWIWNEISEQLHGRSPRPYSR